MSLVMLGATLGLMVGMIFIAVFGPAIDEWLER